MDGAARGFHQSYRELVPSIGDLFPGGNQERLLAAIPGKERAQPIFRGVLLGVVGQHHQANFMIASLPCRQKTVGGEESRHVVGIGGSLDFGAGEPRCDRQSKNNAENDGVRFATDTHNAIMPEESCPKDSRRASL